MGAIGGVIAKVVELNSDYSRAQAQIRESTTTGHGFSAQACADFEIEVRSKDFRTIDIEARWKVFADKLAREVRAAANRPWLKFCRSPCGTLTGTTKGPLWDR